jgi:hypothetical protein
MRRVGLALLALTACGGPAPHVDPLASGTATAPATAAHATAAPAEGRSDLTVDGEVTLRTTRDLQCSSAGDDFFVRGELGTYDGITVYLALNVEFYGKPGRYAGHSQLLVRRIAVGQPFYASWLTRTATATVLPRRDGADIEIAELPPEAGTGSTRPVTVAGHVACLGWATPGPG